MRWPAMLALILLAPLASGHGDTPSLDEEFSLEPGESSSWTRPVHWHRVLGTLEADGDVVLVVAGETVAGPGRDLRVDHLIRCCEAVWTDLDLAIQNVGDAPVTVAADLAFLHDNWGVIADDAEAGAWWQTLLPILILVGVAGWRARQPDPPPSGHDWLRTSRILHGAAWGAGGVLALGGMLAYGTGPLVGTLAATAPVPSDVAGFFNTHTFVMMALMVAWGTGYGFWAGARRRGAVAPWDGYAFAAGSLVVGALLLVEVDGGWIAVVLGVVPAAAIAADLHVRPPQASADHAPS